jgi:ATP-binding cassette, subfamily B, bacterial
LKETTTQTIRIYWQHARKYKLHLSVLVFAILGTIAVNSYYPYLYKLLFDAIGSGAADSVPAIIYRILVVSTLGWLFWRLAFFCADYFQPSVMRDIMNTSFKEIHKHSHDFFTNNFAGSLVKKASRLERSFENIADQFSWFIAPAIIRLIIICVIVGLQYPALGFAIFLWSIVYAGLNYWFVSFKMRFDLEKSELDSKVSGYLADTVANEVNLKVFSSFEREYISFKNLTQKHFKVRKLTWNLSSLQHALQGALSVLLEFVVIYSIYKLWRSGQATVGDFAFLQAYLIQIFGMLNDLGYHLRTLFESLSDAEEMTVIMSTKPEIRDLRGAKELKVKRGSVAFSGVDFAYNKNKKIFDNFNLSVTGGERVALVGPSGGGKSTIIKLLLRFSDIQKGKITIDGQDISKVKQDSLRQAIAFVPQEPILFHRSLYENIAYAKPDATPEEVYEAARLAHCHEFITELPDTYETFVGERGVKLSGGERQRVAIARAILKNAPILILDEATSSLDSESEMLIQDALKNLMKAKTVIVIAHRLSTIMQMDRIMVIEKGRIIEEGKHSELVKAKQGMYQKLWQIQAGSFGG